MNTRESFSKHPFSVLIMAFWFALSLLPGCATEPRQEASPSNSSSQSATASSSDTADEYSTVDCLLPGQMRRLGTHVTFVTARRPTRTTAEDCAIRGGEYTASDRADYKTSLKLWLDAAQEGDPEAQYYVGSLYEKGPNKSPDYALAAVWYEKAAKQGFNRAAMNLGRLHEQGLGVNKNPTEAFKWYAKASGIDESGLSMLMNDEAQGRIKKLESTVAEREGEIHSLQSKINKVTKELTQLRKQLQQRSSVADEERQKLSTLQQQYDGLKETLQQQQAKPDQQGQITKYQQELAHLRQEMDLREQTLGTQDEETTKLRHQIDALHQSAAAQTQQMEAMAKQGEGRVESLQTSVQQRERQMADLQGNLDTVNQQLAQLESQLQQRTQEGQAKQGQFEKEKDQHQQRIRKLELALADSKKHAEQRPSPEELDALKTQLDHQRKVVKEREEEVTRLHQHVASLEGEAAKRAKEMQATPVVDLGFAGPTLEIIDPPIATRRGIKLVQDLPSISSKVGVARHISGRVIAPAGLRTLTVNGLVVKVEENGIFSMDLPPLQAGQDSLPIEILAVDIQNKRATTKLLLTASQTVVTGLQIPKEDLEVFGNYYALVIGNNRYQHWNPLKNAVADAQAVATILQNRYGFDVTFLQDATRRDTLKALNSFRKRLKGNDNLLVYYAGHGHLESDIDRGYWIPVDAEIDDTSQWILTPSITDLLELMSAKHILVVADSCFAGKLTRSSLAKLRPGLSEDSRMTMLKTIAKKRVRTALTSGGEHPVLDVGGGGHSVFTSAFLEVLQENQIILETERLFWAVRTRVVNASSKYDMEQIPTYWPIQFAGHESLGDFIFVPQQS